MDTRELGRYGEDRAARYLQHRGYTIRERNYRCRFGEIDLIAQKGDYVVFVEVKLRKDDRIAEAREFVTRSKQEKIMRTAAIWLSQNDCNLQPRFDVIEIYTSGGPFGTAKTEHIKDAFS